MISQPLLPNYLRVAYMVYAPPCIMQSTSLNASICRSIPNGHGELARVSPYWPEDAMATRANFRIASVCHLKETYRGLQTILQHSRSCLKDSLSSMTLAFLAHTRLLLAKIATAHVAIVNTLQTKRSLLGKPTYTHHNRICHALN